MKRLWVLSLGLLVVSFSLAGFLIGRLNTTQEAKTEDRTKPVNKVETATISAVIIPHHDAVKSIRQKFLEKVGKRIDPPKTIILLSPNHYQSGRGGVQTTDRTWEITDRTIKPDKPVIKSLSELATDEPDSFTNEHGIKLVLGDLWQNFPNAKIVPIIFKDDVTKETIERLAQVLNRNCQACLLVASVDFSHYQPVQLANLHDQLTARALQTLDVDKLLLDAEVDSPPALALTALWAKNRQTEQFILERQTNSSALAKNPELESTSHFFGYYQPGKGTIPPPSVSFIIGGDMMFGRMIAHTFLPGGLSKSLDKLGNRVFWGTDASIVNLEGAVSATPVPDDIRSDNLVFNFPPETIQALRFIKVKSVSLANNHSANAGASGLATTRQLLEKAKIKSIGGPTNTDVEKTISFSGHGLTLNVIGVHTLVTQPDLVPLIKKLKADPTHRVLVFPHWGVEYQPKHSAAQEKLAHAWIDAGADLVIGAHPHVIQDAEIYKGKPIFYSLGNLLFDQAFSTETQRGLLIAGELTESGMKIFALPTQSVKYKPQLMRGTAKTEILTKLYQPLASYVKQDEAGSALVLPNN